MKFNGVVVTKWDFEYFEQFVYVDTGDTYHIRLDREDFKDEMLPNIGDEVQIETRGKFWIRAKIIHRLKVNWKKDGF